MKPLPKRNCVSDFLRRNRKFHVVHPGKLVTDSWGMDNALRLLRPYREGKMSKLKLIWGLLKVVGPSALADFAYRGARRTVVDGRKITARAQAASELVQLIRGDGPMPSVEESRKQLDALATKFDLPCPADVAVKDVTLEGAFGARRARIYAPEGQDPEAGAPTLLFLHGGGWVQGSIESHDGLCGYLAKQSGVRVVSYDYVLAPEYRFPDLPDDVLAVYRGLANGALGCSPDQLVVGGDSAGANLTAVLMHDLSTAGDTLPRGQLLIYPAVDGRLISRSNEALATQPLLPRKRIDWFFENYLPEGQDVTDPRFSPLFSDQLAGQPPAHIVAGGHDPLWDDALSYGEALSAAGVLVSEDRYEGQVHGFLNLRKVLPEGQRAAEGAAHWLRGLLG